VICLLAAAFSSIITVSAEDSTRYSYLEIDADQSFAYLFFVAFGTWFIAFMNLVPISLMVTLEVVKFIQATFIEWDAGVFDLEKNQPAKVQSSNLNEELGMIHYIFSDKTGTLTQNVMEFKKFTAGAYSYGLTNVNPENQKHMAPGVTNVKFEDPQFYEHYANREHPNYPYIRRFVELLGLCHTVIEEYTESEVLKYNASSPDELALVNASRYFGFEFRGRDIDNNILINDRGVERTYKLLNVIEFTSLRKRMTTVLYDNERNEIKVFIKGADNIILPLLRPGQGEYTDIVQTNLDNYAKEGLRTLLVGEKTLSEEEYDAWNEEYKSAMLNFSNREVMLARAAEKLEHSFTLVGATAIEDRLQDDVAETIAFIRKAGIKLWVLTGDKVETAINIGYSCALLEQDMEIFVVDATTSQEVMIQITGFIRDQKLMASTKTSVVVGGDTLLRITQNERVRDEFLDLCSTAQSVLCCRVSPKQKAEVVMMLRKQYPAITSLAIGDGANDVNMITSAHVGIGISGLEGQ